MPWRAAREMPATIATGAARIKGQGVPRPEHGQRAHRIARDQPGGAGDRQRQRHEQERIAIGQADERRLLGLRRRYQTDDAGVGALLGGRDCRQVERIAGVDRAALGAAPGGRRTGSGSPVSVDSSSTARPR